MRTPATPHARSATPGRRIRRAVTVLLLALPLIGAADGIPPRSLPRLIRLQDELATLDAAELRLAVQYDGRLPALQGHPLLALSVRPAIPGAFAPIEERLPLQPLRSGQAEPGLPAATSQRPWLLFSLGRLAREHLHAAQARLRELQASRSGHDRTRVSLQIEQQDLLPRDPTFATTHWEAWLRSSREEGFYPIWTGTVQELARESRAGF